MTCRTCTGTTTFQTNGYDVQYIVNGGIVYKRYLLYFMLAVNGVRCRNEYVIACAVAVCLHTLKECYGEK